MNAIFETGPHLPVETVEAGARSLGDILVRRAAATPQRAASYVKVDGDWQKITWSELFEQARQVARGLADLDLESGDRIAILGPTRIEWARYDLGAQLLGLVSIGVYPLQAPDQVRYLLEHSECRVIFVCGADELETTLAAATSNDHLVAIVPWQKDLAERYADKDPRILSATRFTGDALDDETLEQHLTAIDPDSPAMLIYTSGTTGAPKAAMITHRNVLTLLRHQNDIFPFLQDDLLISFLPMAHVTERNLAFWVRINSGVAAAYASSIGQVLAELQEIRPTVFGSVPRLFEKAYAKIRGELAKKGAAARWVFAWAEGVGRRRSRKLLDGNSVPALLDLQFRLAHRLVFHKIQAAFGGRVRACITGAAPISREILEFLWAVGLPVYEAYGMTEATVVTHINRADRIKLGTVGQVIECLECRTADDGEILLRGPLVFKGYFKNDAATRETIRGGWLYSGDIGEIDGDGYLRITDRKKHLIITAGGKNLAPATIERAIKAQSPLISQVHAHGDRRPYVSALIAPSPIETLEWGAEERILDRQEVASRLHELQENPTLRSPELNSAMALVVRERRFQELFLEPVRLGNQQLARVERVRRFVVLERDFSQETGELTPTMKLKRKAVENQFEGTFQRIYDEEDFALNVDPAAARPLN